MRPNRHIIVGTAGHVDHGKTELVKALTGVNTDRLKEEQERGISIELGFAEMLLPSGDRVGLVDVPGHERFVKAMVAGAAGMDLGMLIVAADESVMPQTREHLEILQLLGLQGGVVVVTKCDLADDDMLDLVAAEIDDLVRGTFLETAPRVRVSARTGAGLDALRQALDSETAKLPSRPLDAGFRLPIDRVFTLAGVGLLVTGTAWSGTVREGDAVDVLPPGLPARVRGIQVHGQKRQAAFAGERVAINLHGVKNDAVARGMQVASAGLLRASFMLDVKLHVLPGWSRPLAQRARVRIHHGASEILGRVVLLDRDELGPGEAALAQLRLESPLAAERGDRIVLRQYSPMRTLGGAVVLDATPDKHKRYRADVLAALALRDAGGAHDVLREEVRRAGVLGATAAELRAARCVADAALLPALADLTAHGMLAQRGETYYDVAMLGPAAERVVRLASEYQHANPLAWGIGRAELQERLGHRGSKARFGELLELLAQQEAPIHLRPDAVRAGAAEHELPPADVAALEQIEALLREGGTAPPTPSELQSAVSAGPRFAALVRMLEERGAVVRAGDTLLFHAGAIAAVEAQLRAHWAQHERLSMADFKDLTGLSRKFAVPLLEYFDRKGITQRFGDDRRPGPALRAG